MYEISIKQKLITQENSMEVFMKLKKVQKILDAQVLEGKEFLNLEVEYGYSCDLMSDVLAFVKNNVLLLTGLNHPQVIRTAEMLDIKAITFVRGKQPTENILEMAKAKEMVVFTTNHSLYTASGLLFAQGLLGEEIAHEAAL